MKLKLAMTVLDRALTTKRPHGDASTAKFCAWLYKLLPETQSWIDGCGNMHVDMRQGDSRSLFVAHVDTVHHKGGRNKVIKTEKKWSANGAPLGADDGVGCAVLVHMIHSGVPGYYVFTQGEEVGGIGAKYLANTMPGLLEQFDRAIAFDRRATYSVITHQGWNGRCASDTFGEALSAALCERGMLFMPDDTGVYTDTAEFTDYIGECTNISAGYDMEHSDRETLDMDHFRALCKAVVKLEWESLPTVRKPGEVEVVKSLVIDKWYDRDDDDGRVPFMWSDDFDDFKYKTAEFDLDLMNALEDAFDGNKRSLVSMIAAAASPASPRVAERQIDQRLITESFLAGMLQDAQCMDTDTLLMSAFDEIGTGAWA